MVERCFRAKPTNDIPPLEYTSDTGGRIIAFSDSDKVDLLINYFSSVSNVDDSFQQLPQIDYTHHFSLSDVIIDEQDIKDKLSILSVNKAIGPDAISHKVLKSTLHSVVKPLYCLLNRSLSENVFLIPGKLQMFYLCLRKTIHVKLLIIDTIWLCQQCHVKSYIQISIQLFS